MKLLLLDLQDRTARVVEASRFVAMARNANAVAMALRRFRHGFPGVVPSPNWRAKGWKIVEVLRT